MQRSLPLMAVLTALTVSLAPLSLAAKPGVVPGEQREYGTLKTQEEIQAIKLKRQQLREERKRQRQLRQQGKQKQ